MVPNLVALMVYYQVFNINNPYMRIDLNNYGG